MSSITMSATARERESYRYINHRICAEGSITAENVTPISAARSSSEAILTSLAQLCALRLNVRRCLISLFDQHTQYIIAEATRTSPSSDGSASDPEDALLFGRSRSPVGRLPCHLAFGLPDLREQGADSSTQHDCSVIADLAEDPRFGNDAFIQDACKAKSFAGVPIRSPKGINIGSFSVLHDSVLGADGLPSSSVHLLHHMAATTMSHLEAIRVGESHRRGERLIRGLGSFVDGKSTINKWWGESSLVSPDPVGGSAEGQPSQRQQVLQDARDKYVQDMQTPHVGITALDWTQGDEGEGSPTSQKPNRTATERIDPRLTSAMNPEEIGRELRDNTTDSKSQSLQDDALSPEVKKTFSRAANIIRESLEVEGAIFFDASIGGFGRLGRGNTFSSTETATSDGYSSHSSAIDTDHNALSKRQKTESGNTAYCKVLGFSTSSQSSINHEGSPLVYGTFKESALHSLIMKHEHGKIFNFDENGILSAGETSDEEIMPKSVQIASPQPGKTGSVRSTYWKVLTQIFPGSRSIAFIPLHDSHRQRWFAGCVVWTKTVARVLTAKEDLTYLASFGNSIMAEVNRLDTIASHEAKSHLLSSISHELRSPLHGILGSVEFLQEHAISRKDALQSNIAYTIETCGRTLLDTIDHLLDFSKLDRFIASSNKAKMRYSANQVVVSTGKDNTKGLYGTTNIIDVGLITEEVVETVAAGYARKSTITQLQSKGPRDMSDLRPPNPVELRQTTRNELHCILDIDLDNTLVFSTYPGALRRIVMNVFGNALKYTKTGYVKIRLETLAHKTQPGTRLVVLRITDSGRGMSAAFMRERLFQPFSQEDTLAEGTGLGLNIVQRLITMIRGQISVHSVAGSGTDIIVTLPMKHVYSPLDPREQLLPTALIQRFSGKEIQLLGFDNPKEANANIPRDAEKMGRTAMSSSLNSMLSSGLGFKTHFVTGAPREDIPLSILTQEYYIDTKTIIGRHQFTNNGAIVVVLCNSASSAAALRNDHDRRESPGIIEFISSPCGPHKLSRVLALCLDRQANEDAQSSPTPGSDRQTEKPAVIEEAHGPIDIAYLSRQKQATSSQETDLQSHHIRSEGVDWAPDSEPEDATQPQQKVPLHVEAPSKLQSKPRVLLVDDNDINLKLLETCMQKADYNYVTAVNGLEAVEAYKACVEDTFFAVVLMDISMPIMDGLEASRLIRRFERGKKLKRARIIALTGLTNASAQQEAYASGVDLFLSKPVRFKSLIDMLQADEDDDQKAS